MEKDFIKLNNISDITKIVLDNVKLSDSTIKCEKPITFMSGFSSTLKTTLLTELNKKFHSHIIYSPVKLIHRFNYSFNATPIISSITFFYCQFYAMFDSLVSNFDSSKYYFIERGLWDYIYFLKRFNFMNTYFKSTDELDIVKIWDDMLYELNLINRDINVIVLRNDSPKLIGKAINSSEETRKLAYKDADEYIRFQNEYLDSIFEILNKLNLNVIRLSITDNCI